MAKHTRYIRFTDLDHGYLKDDVPALAYPAVLIDLDGTFSQQGMVTQLGDITVRLRLVFSAHSTTDNLSPRSVAEKGLAYFELEHIIHQALQGWTPTLSTPADPAKDIMPPDLFGSFSRIAARTDSRRTDLRIRELTYKISLQDLSTGRFPQRHVAELDLQLFFSQPG
ncbi:hypothetical protein [Nemorincola caseinilytica]